MEGLGVYVLTAQDLIRFLRRPPEFVMKYIGCQKQKGKQKRFPFLRWAVWAKLLHADCDLFRLSLFGFGNMYFENAVSIRGVDSIVLYGLRQVKGTGESTRNPLGSLVLDAVSRLLKFSLATKGQYSVMDLQVEIFSFHSRKLGANEIRLLAL